jgi:diguanylate cyclase (GGDEF)-like protein
MQTAAVAPSGRSILGLEGARRVWLLTAVLVAVGAAITLLVLPRLDGHPAGVRIPWWLLVVGFYLAEVRVLHLQFGREAHSFTLSDVPLVVGLILATPGDLVVAAVVGAGLGLVVHRRPAPMKYAFNLALFFLGANLAAVVYHSILTATSTSSMLAPQLWAAAFAATILVNMAGIAAINAAIRIAQGRTDRRALAQSIRVGLIVAFTNTALALIGVTMLFLERDALWLLAIPITLLAVAYRSYRAVIAEREQEESLELLYGSTRILHGSAELPDAIEEMLQSARRKFRAEVAEIILFTNESATEGLRSVIGPDGFRETMVEVQLEPATDALRLRAVRERRGFLAPRLRRGEQRNDRAARRQIRDAMVAPLLGERSIIGTFLVANRLGELGGYRAEEQLLFETLANHAGVALENGQLGRSLKQTSEAKEQLRYQAFHDELTGLANRALFLDRLEVALGDRTTTPAVLFVDLDDFKTVNDRFGHAAGDELLRAVAGRLRNCVRPQDLAARLGGDEFALLIADGSDLGGVIRIAERVIDSVRRPVRADGIDLSTQASVGIATATGATDDAASLLRGADIAMYTAKTRGKGRFALFESSMEAAAAEREELREELERAISGEQLTLRYQPITDLRTGEPTGIEALVRWQHPTRGLLEPSAFLEIAEESGLAVALGRWVLATACRQARAWRIDEAAPPLSLSVNLSRRQLQHADLAADIAVILRAEGLAAERLVLEISETVMSGDAPGVDARLAELKALGVRIAIDDFGSGLSSLGRLGRGPVDILKIARPFVDSLDRSAEGARIADAIVALGHSLGLAVVAEGIERPGQLEHLRSLACDSGQGYLLARPLDVAGIARLLGGARTAVAAA